MVTRWGRGGALRAGAVVLSLVALEGSAWAGSFDMFGLDASYNVQLSYALAMRIQKPNDGVINAEPSPKIPLPRFMKLPESINYDDGDRNFDQHALVNNRLSALAEFQLQKGDLGLLVRGDGFYDRVYRGYNDNDSPDTINKSRGETNQFTEDAQHYDGKRARLLDAYLYGSWYLSDEAALNLRIGSHIAAWGESLFFSGMALAQSPADATKATVPGADVKSILLPVNQVSMQLSLNADWTVLGQYKLQFKETEINPVGEAFSIADVLGPGAEFIYGIYNPLYLSNLARADITSEDLNTSLQTIAQLMPPEIGGPLGTIFAQLPNMPEFLPSLNLPLDQIDGPFPGTPKFINVQRGPDIKPKAGGQWGVGVKYQVSPITNIGLFRLRYHSTIGLPVQNYGYSVLIPAQGPRPAITTNDLGGLQVPVTYQVKYFDGVDMTALSATTTLFGANWGLETTYREGIPVLVDVVAPLLGPVPTPSRANVSMVDLNALYLIGPALFWDSFILVGDVGFNHVNKVAEACGPKSCSDSLTYDRDAWAWAFLGFIDKKNFYPGWDWQVPISLQGVGDNHTSLLGGFGSLMGEGDYRAGIGFNFTYLQQTTLGLTYSGFIGRPDFRDRPYQDRDNVALTVLYRF
ncbi:MAG TPA: DUF1302 family protein [Solimonas sp.]|nr:DUF1302 family protein [Solimonas sp.]